MDEYHVGSDDACEFCGSQRFHLEAGETYCENGHQQQDINVGEDEGDYGTQGKRVRRKEEKKVRTSKVLRGKKAYKLFLQAYQYLLWKQCYALVHEKGLPAELWTVVRDLWTLQFSSLVPRLEEDEVLASTQESDGLSSLAPESGNETTGPENSTAGNAPATKKRSGSPTLIHTVALCYTGMLLLRLPVTLFTILRWVREDSIVYLRAIRHVPPGMKERLPGEYHEALDTQSVLSRDHLQTGVFHLLKFYEKSFGMECPPVNWTLLLFEHVKDLALPLEIYKAVKSLNQIVAFDFKFDVSRSRRKAISLPEAQLMSLIVVTTKLLYPFDADAVKRYPRSLNEPAALRIDWTVWVDGQKHFKDHGKEKGGIRRGEEVHVKDTDIFNMSEKQLDQYMDWYQRTWVRTEVAGEDVNRNILDMFPLKSIPEQESRKDEETDREAAIQSKLREVQASLKLRQPISDNEAEVQDIDVTRPGSHYAIYRIVQDLDEQPVAKAFYEAAAEAGCLSLETLMRAVLQTERRITIWRNARKRAERFGEEFYTGPESGGAGGRDVLDGGGLAEGVGSVDGSVIGDGDGQESGSDLEMDDW